MPAYIAIVETEREYSDCVSLHTYNSSLYSWNSKMCLNSLCTNTTALIQSIKQHSQYMYREYRESFVLISVCFYRGVYNLKNRRHYFLCLYCERRRRGFSHWNRVKSGRVARRVILITDNSWQREERFQGRVESERGLYIENEEETRWRWRESPSVILNNKAPSAPSPLYIRYLDNHLLSLEAIARHNSQVIHPLRLLARETTIARGSCWFWSSSNRLLHFRPARIHSFSSLSIYVYTFSEDSRLCLLSNTLNVCIACLNYTYCSFRYIQLYGVSFNTKYWRYSILFITFYFH